jgi:hypothetical protein
MRPRPVTADPDGMYDAETECMRQRVRSLSVLSLLGLALAACGDRAAAPAAAPFPNASAAEARHPLRSGGKVRAEMKEVHLIADPSVTLEIRSLHGELVPTHKGEPPWFDDPSTFQVKIDRGEIAITPAGMSAIMNNYVFNYPGAPVGDIKIEIDGGRLKQTATLKRKIPVKTTIEGDLSVTPEGDIRLHPAKIKAEGLPVKGLLDLFDVELDEMIKTRESKGVRIVDNDFILDPEKLLPSPRMLGRVTAVRLERDRIVQIFGGGAKTASLKPSFPEEPHYIFFRGGELSFGKLTMHGADLQIIDKDPKDPFLFYLKHFDQQLVAGYSRTLSDKGLAAFVPDFDEIGR